MIPQSLYSRSLPPFFLPGCLTPSSVSPFPATAVTSHSSQGATADRVLVHVDTEQAHERLVNSRLAYVSVSRGFTTPSQSWHSNCTRGLLWTRSAWGRCFRLPRS